MSGPLGLSTLDESLRSDWRFVGASFLSVSLVTSTGVEEGSEAVFPSKGIGNLRPTLASVTAAPERPAVSQITAKQAIKKVKSAMKILFKVSIRDGRSRRELLF